jgi:perosamine synthetase
VRHAIAVQSGTAALHLALKVAGVKDGDEVIVPALTFIAVANAVRYLGASPVFIDVESRYGQLDPQKLEEFLRKECVRQQGRWVNRTTRRTIRAAVVVHSLGHPADLDPIRNSLRDYGIRLVEDAAESIGALYKGKPVGQSGDVACFSFNGNKLITSGGGGMIATGNGSWARRARHLSMQARIDESREIHDEVGFNYRMGAMAAALGCAQLEQLDARIAARRRLAEWYARYLGELPEVRIMEEAEWARSTYWMYTIRLPQIDVPMPTVVRKLAARKIETRPIWQPLSASPAHEGAQSYQVEAAYEWHRTALSLPSSPTLDEEQVKRIVDEIRKAKIL